VIVHGVQFPVAVRPATEADTGYILAHWSDSLFQGSLERLAGNDPTSMWLGRLNDFLGSGWRAEWKARQRSQILPRLSGEVCLVAHRPEEPDTLWGFLSGSPTALHSVFVKQTRRRGGLASALLVAAMGQGVVPLSHSHRTPMGDKWWNAAKERA